MTFVPIHVGDVVRLRKQHACGGWEWEVVRTGADIGLVCRTCKRRLLVPRDQFRRWLKSFVYRAATEPTEVPPPGPDTLVESEDP